MTLALIHELDNFSKLTVGITDFKKYADWSIKIYSHLLQLVDLVEKVEFAKINIDDMNDFVKDLA